MAAVALLASLAVGYERVPRIGSALRVTAGDDIGVFNYQGTLQHTVDDLPIDRATRLWTDPVDGYQVLYSRIGVPRPVDSQTSQEVSTVSTGGEVLGSVQILVNPWQATIYGSGSFWPIPFRGMASWEDDNIVEGGSLGLWHLSERTRTDVPSEFWVSFPEFEPGAVVVRDDGVVVFGSQVGGLVDVGYPRVSGRPDPEPAVERLVGPVGDPEARARLLSPVERIITVADLDGGRVAFVGQLRDSYHLFLYDGSSVAPLVTAHPNPVHPGVVEPAGEYTRPDEHAIDHLSVTAEGDLLAVGFGPSGHPEVNLIDPDTGDVELLIELEGIVPSRRWPISAALVGDDLYFIADGQLWLLEGATR